MELPSGATEQWPSSPAFCVVVFLVFDIIVLLLLRIVCLRRHLDEQVLAVQRQQITQIHGEESTVPRVSGDLAVCATEDTSQHNAEFGIAFSAPTPGSVGKALVVGDFCSLPLDAWMALHEPFHVAAQVASDARTFAEVGIFAEFGGFSGGAGVGLDVPLTAAQSNVGCGLPSSPHSQIVAAETELDRSLACEDFGSLPPAAWAKMQASFLRQVHFATPEIILQPEVEIPTLIGSHDIILDSDLFDTPAPTNCALDMPPPHTLVAMHEQFAFTSPNSCRGSSTQDEITDASQHAHLANELCQSVKPACVHFLESSSLMEADEVEWLDSSAAGAGLEPVASPVASEMAAGATSTFRFLAESPPRPVATCAAEVPVSTGRAPSELVEIDAHRHRCGTAVLSAHTVSTKKQQSARGRKPASASLRVLVRKTSAKAFVRRKNFVSCTWFETASWVFSPMPEVSLDTAASSLAQQPAPPKTAASADFDDVLRSLPSPFRHRPARANKI